MLPESASGKKDSVYGFIVSDSVSVSPMQMAKLLETLGKIIRELKSIQQDYVRAKVFGYRFRYLLDFDQLFPQLWPEIARGSRAAFASTRELLWSSSGPQFSLPPGAMAELAFHLSKDRAQFKEHRGAVTSLIANPFYRTLVEQGTLQEGTTAFHFSQQMREHVRSLRSTDARLGQLDEMFASRKLTLVEDQVSPNLLLFSKLVEEIERQSKGTTRGHLQNRADSYNYALADSLSTRKAQDSREIYVLVTSSPVLLGVLSKPEYKWHRDPLRTTGLVFSNPHSLVRTPSEVMFLTRLLGSSYIDQHKLLMAV